MPNDECQMTKEIQSPNIEGRSGVHWPGSSFGFRYSFGFRHSSFGFGKWFMESPLSVFFRMHWDHEPAWEIQSAAEAAHSKTWRKFERLWPTRQRLGMRRPSAAFLGSAHSEFGAIHGKTNGQSCPTLMDLGRARLAEHSAAHPKLDRRAGVCPFHISWDPQSRPQADGRRESGDS